MPGQHQDPHRCSMCGKVLPHATETLASVQICEECNAGLKSIMRARIKEIEEKALRNLRGPNPADAA